VTTAADHRIVVALFAGDDPEAVALDFVQPAGPGGRALGRCGEARLDRASQR
jgi:hypothetical protein